VVATAIATFWLARKFVHRIGGYTGDCLGAVQQVTEVMFYLCALAACRDEADTGPPSAAAGRAGRLLRQHRPRHRAGQLEQTLAALKLPAGLPIYSSPLRRCAELAARLSDNIIYDARLAEMHFGDWEMLPWDAIPRAAIDAWAADMAHYRPAAARACCRWPSASHPFTMR
jgi:hypothetical protein